MDTKPGDADLIARSRAGDRDAFRTLFDRKHKSVYLVAYQIIGDRALAEDVVQEVFLSLWRHLAAYDPSRSLDAWLRRVASNRAIDFWRRRKAEGSKFVEASGGSDPPELKRSPGFANGRGGELDPTYRLGWQQLQEIWDDIAAPLPPQQRAAFVLRHIEGIPTSAVADALECTTSTVRSHVAEARRSLRAAIRKRYPELLDRR